MPKPRVFLSSTCFDLAAVRDELGRFIAREMGYEAIMSEHSSFPVDPDRTTIENSQLAVKSAADIFVLIIGGRYGSINPASNRSITNSEYVEAIAKGIPIYIFLHRDVDVLLPVWQANPDHFEHPSIESPRVFEFVQEIRAARRWTFSFTLAPEIIDVLRVQWAYLQQEGLQTRALLAPINELQVLGLTGVPLQIAVQKQGLWEYRLFLALMDAELTQRTDLRRDVDLGFAVELDRRLSSIAEVIEWSSSHLERAQRITSSFESLVEELMASFGEPGEPGDPARIRYSCSRLGRFYEASLEWAMAFRKIAFPDEARQIMDITSHFLDGVRDSFEDLISRFRKLVEDAEEGRVSGQFELAWTLTVPDELIQQHSTELARLSLQL